MNFEEYWDNGTSGCWVDIPLLSGFLTIIPLFHHSISQGLDHSSLEEIVKMNDPYRHFISRLVEDEEGSD